MSVDVPKVLNTIDGLAELTPVIASAAGLPTTGLASDLVAEIPHIESVLHNLLAIFTKHSELIKKNPTHTAAPEPVPPQAA